MRALRSLKAVFLLLCILILTGCWDKIEIENRLFVLSMGVDKAVKKDPGDSEERFSLTYVAPIVSQVMDGEGNAFNTYKTEDDSVIMALSHLLGRFSKQQFFGHTRAIFFGEEIMKDEKLLKEVIDGVARYHEIHNSMYAYIVPGRAEDIFKVKPMYDKLLGPYITGITENSDYSSRILKLSLSDAIIMLIENDGGLVIPRVIPEKDEVKVNGSGVIKNFKLIGYLGDTETEAYNWLTDKAKGGIISVKHENVIVAFRHFDFKRDIKLLKIEEGKIYLTYNMETEGSIEEYMMGKRILDVSLLREVEREVGDKIEKESEKLVRKFQEEYRIDLIGAKDYLSKYHPKLFKTIEKEYEDFFTDNIVIKVNADVKIRRIGIRK